MMYYSQIKDLELAMSNCYQFKDINMIDHGIMVHDSYIELINQFNGGKIICELPPQISELYHKTKHMIKDLNQYHVYHDCGKSLCRIVEDGKQKFPSHAFHSYRQYLEIWKDDYETAELILMDMNFHMMKGNELNDLWNHPLAPSLYFTAWAEIISNCEMFGGQDSINFKIKKKQLINAAKKFCM